MAEIKNEVSSNGATHLIFLYLTIILFKGG